MFKGDNIDPEGTVAQSYLSLPFYACRGCFYAMTQRAFGAKMTSY